MPIKNPTDIQATLTKRLNLVWAKAAAGAPFDWQPRVTLGTVTASSLARDLPRYSRWARDWTQTAANWGVRLETRTQHVERTPQQLPAAIEVPDVDSAARVVQGAWSERLRVARQRGDVLRRQFDAAQDAETLARVLRAIDGWSDLDVALLTQAAAWFTTRTGTGLTPRQIPIGGMHAKWLNTSQHLVAALAGRSSLDLAPPHPTRIHFTYLDPKHLSSGGRRHDSYSAGDNYQLPFPPRVVLICENKDTAINFPPVPEGIAVEGDGSGTEAIAATPWIRTAPCVIYWGDMDIDGLRILAAFRSAGVVHHSMLMDEPAYDVWSRYGTNHDRNGKPLAPPGRTLDLNLTEPERTLLERLTDPTHTGHRRVEQERIPLDVAHAELTRLLRRTLATSAD